MGVVFRATQLALQRPVALKAIAPELAADDEYRERFQSESQLAAIIDHPNVIPVYEAGEADETLYLIMRWIDGTDLRQLFNRSPRLPARRAIRLLRPVGSALAAAHRHGLVHRDVKPANVLIARSYEDEDEDHIYLTDFGIARRSDGKSLTGTGKFVGTIDYMAPERIEGKKGDASCDTYSLGCMLFEALTGHVPYDRPTDISKMFAQVNDPIPRAGDEVDGVPELLDEIITKSMAKRREDRFASAGEMTAALGRALLELETGERAISPPSQRTVPSRPATPELTKLSDRTAIASEPTAAISEPTAAMSEPTAAISEPTAAVSEPTAVTSGQTAVTREPGPTEAPPPASRSRRSPVLWVLPVAALVVAVVLVVVLSGGGKTAGALVQIHGSGLTQGRTITVSGPAGSVSVGIKNLWVSLPGRDEIVRSSVATGAQESFPAAGSPTAIAAGVSAVWVAEPGLQALAQFNGDSGQQVHFAKLPGTPVAIALDQQDSSAWVTDSSGAITHVALGATVAGTPGHSAPPASSLGFGEGGVWGTNGTSKGLVRVDPGTSGSTSTFSAGANPVGVAVDQGVWTANADGRLTRFDPRPGQLRLTANLAVAPELDAVAATDPGPFVWALSKKTKTLYRITATGTPAVTGTVVFGSPPVALAAAATSVWVAMQGGEVVQIEFS
jgi:serine/threonine protein kinase